MGNNKIISIGEVLVDWVCLDRTLDLNKAVEFVKAFGGAPANVAVGLAKLNYPVQFLGGFSDDIFGKWLKEYLEFYGVDTTLSQNIPNSNTRQAYVLTDTNGDRTLLGFTASNCADSMLDIERIDINSLACSPIVYFGSVLQADESSRTTLRNLIYSIKDTAIKVYDPNLRLCLWPDQESAVNVITETIKTVDVLKLSDDEINLITRNNDIEYSAKVIFDHFDLKLLVVTMGSEGSYYINKNGRGFVKPFKVPFIEATGAGDGFVAGLLGGLYDHINNEFPAIENLTGDELEQILYRANAIGALTTTKPGATSALPTRQKLDEFLQRQVSIIK